MPAGANVSDRVLAADATTSDEDLLAAWRQSADRTALEKLVSRSLPQVRKRLGVIVCDDAVADDLTQEAFLRAFRGLGQFRGDARFSTWLYRIARNVAYEHLGRAKRSPVQFGPAPQETSDPEATPEGLASLRERWESVTAAVAELSPKLRAAVSLVCLEGLDAAEAAKIEGCSKATIYWRVHRARKLLKRRLKALCDE